jgi:hypothetical protein
MGSAAVTDSTPKPAAIVEESSTSSEALKADSVVDENGEFDKTLTVNTGMLNSPSMVDVL